MNDVLRLARSCANSITPDSTRSPAEIEQAFRDVFRWIGEDPDRDGLRETPGRLVRAYQEYFSGYRQDPEQILRRHSKRRTAMTRWWCYAAFHSKAIANITLRRSLVAPG